MLLYYTISYIHVLHVASHQLWTDAANFLHKIQRGVRAIQGDGNCLFRALSTIICNNENSHQYIRRLLVVFSWHNKQRSKAFCHPVPVEEHINGMEQDRVWHTDLELHAAVALWQVKIYVCVPNSTMSSYSWICFKPMPLSLLTISARCEELPCPPGDFHFELLRICTEMSLRRHYWSTWIPARLPSSNFRYTSCSHNFVMLVKRECLYSLSGMLQNEMSTHLYTSHEK